MVKDPILYRRGVIPVHVLSGLQGRPRSIFLFHNCVLEVQTAEFVISSGKGSGLKGSLPGRLPKHEVQLRLENSKSLHERRTALIQF